MVSLEQVDTWLKLGFGRILALAMAYGAEKNQKQEPVDPGIIITLEDCLHQLKIAKKWLEQHPKVDVNVGTMIAGSIAGLIDMVNRRARTMIGSDMDLENEIERLGQVIEGYKALNCRHGGG